MTPEDRRALERLEDRIDIRLLSSDIKLQGLAEDIADIKGFMRGIRSTMALVSGVVAATISIVAAFVR